MTKFQVTVTLPVTFFILVADTYQFSYGKSVQLFAKENG
jgi:hypothetical protein